MKTRSIVCAAAVACSAMALSACGGGGGDDTPAVTSAVPVQASQSSMSFTEYLRQLVASVNVDDFQPVDLSGVSNPPEDNDSDAAILQ